MHCCLKACWICVKCSHVHRPFAHGLYVPWAVVTLVWVWRGPVCVQEQSCEGQETDEVPEVQETVTVIPGSALLWRITPRPAHSTQVSLSTTVFLTSLSFVSTLKTEMRADVASFGGFSGRSSLSFLQHTCSEPLINNCCRNLENVAQTFTAL